MAMLQSIRVPLLQTILRTQYPLSKTLRRAMLDTESSLRFARDTHDSPAKARHTHLETSSLPRTATGAPRNWTPPFTAHLPDGERRNRLRTCPSALSCPLMCSTTCHTWTQLPLPCSNYAPRSESQSRSPTALNGRIETRHCVGSEKSYSGHTPTLRLFTVDCCYFHLPDHWQAPVTSPAAIVLPVLALVFLSLLTSLADVTRRTLSSYVPGSRPGIVSRMKLMRISASRTQKDWLTHRRKAFTVRHRLQ